jgi:hypothetical protein
MVAIKDLLLMGFFLSLVQLTIEFTCILEHSGKMSGETICYVVYIYMEQYEDLRIPCFFPATFFNYSLFVLLLSCQGLEVIATQTDKHACT